MPSIPNWSGVDTPQEFLAMPNSSTGGYFWAGINLMTFLVLFITLSLPFGWEAGMLSAGFISLMMALFLAYLDLVAWWIVGTFIGLLLLMFVYIIWSSKYD